MSIRPRISAPVSSGEISSPTEEDVRRLQRKRRFIIDLSPVTKVIQKSISSDKPTFFAAVPKKPAVKRSSDSGDKSLSPNSSCTRHFDIGKRRDPIVFDLRKDEKEDHKPTSPKRRSQFTIDKNDVNESRNSLNESRSSLNETSFRSPASSKPVLNCRFQQPPVYKGRDGRYYVAFFTNKYVFSNHFMCPSGVTVDNIKFPTTEHYYMYEKARFHNDNTAAKKILDCDDPKYAKRITSKFEKFDVDGWKKIQYGIMKKACLEKFKQNPILRKELFRTANAVLVEASPSDRRWGVGLSIDNLDVADEDRWRGTNLLGNLLMQVRTLLATEYADEFESELSDAKSELRNRATVC